MPGALDLTSQAAQEERELFGSNERNQFGVVPGDNIRIANLVFGEVGRADQKDDVLAMVTSSVLNRLEAANPKLYGATVDEVIHSTKAPFFAATDNTTEFQKAQQQKFTPAEELRYKKILQVVNGVMRGTIPRHEARHFFTGPELSGIKRSKTPSTDLKKLRETGKVGKYFTFTDKNAPSGS